MLWHQNKAASRQYHLFHNAALNGSGLGGKFCFAVIVLQLLAINVHSFNLEYLMMGKNIYVNLNLSYHEF